MEEIEKYIKGQTASYRDYKNRLVYTKDTATLLGYDIQSKILSAEISWINDTLDMLEKIQSMTKNEKGNF
jgi:hypothetical protein